MPIDGMTISKSATAVFSGGTPVVLQTDSTPVKRGIHVIDVGNPNFFTREHATFKSLAPVRQGNGTYSKARRDINYTIPVQDPTTLEVSYVTVDINFSLPAGADTSLLSMIRTYAAQLCLDTDLDNYFSTGTTK
jgi:hypothetical protein